MKKIFLICFLVSIYFTSFAQYPLQQNIGSGSTIVQNPNYGSFKGGLIPYTFSDTSQANSLLVYGKNYNGFEIYTQTPQAKWWRLADSSKWIMILPQGGGTPVSGQAWINPGNFNLFTDAKSNAGMGTLQANGIYWKTNGITRAYWDRNGIAPATGTSVGIGIDPSDSNRVTFFTGGSGVSGWGLTGNAGTVAGTNFLGTTDANDLVLKRNSVETFRLKSGGALQAVGYGGGAITGAITRIALKPDASGNIVEGYTGIGGVNDNVANIVNFGADSTGVSDSKAAFDAALASGAKSIYIPAGTFIVSSQIQWKDNVSLFGAGKNSSIIKLTGNYAAIKISLASGGNNSSFRDFGFYGTLGSGTTVQEGILIDSAYQVLVDGISAVNMAGFMVDVINTGYCCASYITNSTRGLTVTNSFGLNTYGGVAFGSKAEYCTVSNCNFSNTTYGISNSGGNNRINGNNCSNNTYGLYMIGGSNNGHGVAVGNIFNHNVCNIYLDGITIGFSFDGTIATRAKNGNAGLIEIKNSINVTFSDSYFIIGDTVRVTNSTKTSFNGYYNHGGVPLWVVVSGEAPTVTYTGKINNTFSLLDVVNNKQFNLYNYNGSVGMTLDGAASDLKVGIGSNTPDSALTNEKGLWSKRGVRFSGLLQLSSLDTTNYKVAVISSTGDVSKSYWPTGGSMVYPGAGIALSTGSAWGTSITDNSANWNTAYTDRLKWDGGATGLTAATGRTSLGGTTIGQAMFTSTNPSAITFGRANADNTFDWLSASAYRSAIGAVATFSNGDPAADTLLTNPGADTFVLKSFSAGYAMVITPSTTKLTLKVDTSIIVNKTGTQTLTNKILTSPVINTPTGIVKGDVGLGNVDNTSDATKNAAAVQLTNKAWVPRVGSTTSSATPTINTDNTDIYKITALTVDITSFTTNLSGTPYDGQIIQLQITGTASRALTFGSSFVDGRDALPTTTSGTTTKCIVFQYTTGSSYGTNKWACWSNGN